MKVVTYEGVVENGRIEVLGGVSLPEKAKVYIVVRDVYEVELPRNVHFRSPHLADPSKAAFFELEVTEEGTDA